MKKSLFTIFLLLFGLTLFSQELLSNRYFAFGGNIIDFVPYSQVYNSTITKFSSVATNGRAVYAVDSSYLYKYDVFFHLLSKQEIDKDRLYELSFIELFSNCDTSLSFYLIAQIHNDLTDTIKFSVSGTLGRDTVWWDLTRHKAFAARRDKDTLWTLTVDGGPTKLLFKVRKIMANFADTLIDYQTSELAASTGFYVSQFDTIFSKAAISPDGKLLALSADSTVYLFDADLENGAVLSKDAFALGEINTMAFSPESKMLYLASDSGFYQYDISNKQLHLVSDKSFSGVYAAPDGHVYATGKGRDKYSFLQVINPDAIAGTFSFAFSQYRYDTPVEGALLYSSKVPWLEIVWQRPALAENDLTFSIKNYRLPQVSYYRWYVNGKDYGIGDEKSFYLPAVGDNTIKAYAYFSSCGKSFRFTTGNIVRRAGEPVSLKDTLVCDTPFSIPLKINFSNALIDWKYDYADTDIVADTAVLDINFPGIYTLEVKYQDTVLFDTLDVAYDGCPKVKDVKVTFNKTVLSENEENLICMQNEVGGMYLTVKLEDDYQCNDLYTVKWLLNGKEVATGKSGFYTFEKSGQYLLTVIAYTAKNCPIVRNYSLKLSINPISAAMSEEAISLLASQRKTITAGGAGSTVFLEPNRLLNKKSYLRMPIHKILYDSQEPVQFSAECSTEVSAALNADDKLSYYFVAAADSFDLLKIELVSPDGKLITVKNKTSSDLPFMLGRPFYKFYNEPQEEDRAGFEQFVTTDGISWTELIELSEERSHYVLRYSQQRRQFYDLWSQQEIQTASSMQEFDATPFRGSWQTRLYYDKSHTGKKLGYVDEVGVLFPEKYFIDTVKYQLSWHSSDSALVVEDKNSDPHDITVYSHLPGSYKLTLTVSDNIGCSYDYDIDFRIIEAIFVDIPNTFTPNGDGINDTWDLSYSFGSQLARGESVKVVIWNKKGTVVAKFDLKDQPEGWDGTQNGKPLPAGSYWFSIVLEKGQTFRGIVNLVR